MCRAVRLHAAVALELLVPAAHELPQLWSIPSYLTTYNLPAAAAAGSSGSIKHGEMDTTKKKGLDCCGYTLDRPGNF